MNPYYWPSQLVKLDIRQDLCLLAVACVMYLPTRSIVMENIRNNLIFKCKTRKMSFLYAPKHKRMTVCSLSLLCCVHGVRGHLAPVRRCARWVCCAVCCVCGVLGHVAPAHPCARWVCCVACMGRCCGLRTRPSGGRLFVAGRGLVPSGRANVRPDRGWFVAGRSLVCCRARTRPSGRRLFRSMQGLGSVLGADTSIEAAAVLPGTCSSVSSLGAL